VTWAEKFPPPDGPPPPKPEHPGEIGKLAETMAYNRWVKANRNALVAKALDELAEKVEASPTDRIAFVVGTAFLDGSLEPGIFGGMF